MTASLKLATSQGDDVTARVEEEHCSVYIGGRVAILYKPKVKYVNSYIYRIYRITFT